MADTAAPRDRYPMVGPPPVPELGAPWSLRTVRPGGADLDLVHGWMNREHLAATWHQDWDRRRWTDELTGQLAGRHSRPCLATVDGQALAYLEIYRVARDVLAGYYPFEPHDLGIHIAIGDPTRTGRGLGRQLLRAVAAGLLAADPACARVVAEPDVRNPASVRAFGAAGFDRRDTVVLPDKTAALMCHPRRR